MAATLLGSALTCVSAGYAVAAAMLTRRAAVRPDLPATGGEVRASVLKPLCGAEPRLYDNLATLCRQSVTGYQIVCGVRDPDDPAIAVVRRLQQDFPGTDITLVIDPRVHGSNLKVSNLINLAAQARHDLLVVADSDIAVPPDYLVRVTAPLADPGVGIVTCLYRGRPVGAFWAKLGAQFIDDWFAPSVRIAHAGGSRRFAFGATIALRRDTLTQIGGFASLSDRLADDFWLGELTRQAGLRTVLSDVVVTTDVTETRLAELWTHELRWLRTIRSLNPAGFAFTFITFTWPMLVLGVALSPTPAMLAVALAGLVARCTLAGSLSAAVRSPLRDVLLLAGWGSALAGRQVRWRDRILPVRDPVQDGKVL
ncbi:bacteriohopanetetrol glucosamine biosynthesis glycosyltransferase HpnI [Cupriavidus sp. WKF15]|uniref:bacteriohopanetetrol glucosamine biosynthesis glycosyltransferase HpnI n=1 Tax=Cupriavidus sp. WKF15 TaxID=3032282 RepID=UPI0023E1631D|nr:bacteriohopanetetrol glucosamine biosynthesis glycosyltransferase HpnI [Cupriavidus sp. WKF15]WER49183.1 bacteriohopanetetrol glucosamine biosynthesis glycosyltransferase HpnI [Cupriavidus sp. WKF15]